MHRTLSAEATEGVAYPGPITLDTLGDLFAHHRDRFGGWSMKEGDDDDDDDDDDDTPGLGDDDDDDDDDEDDDDAGKGKKKKDDDEDDPDKGAKTALAKERAKVRDLRKKLREATSAGKKKDDDDDDAETKAEEKAKAKWKPRVVNSAARAALLEAGADKPERLLKLVDHDELDISDDGEVEGLDDEVDRLREEYPELFGRRKRGGKIETGDRSGKGVKKAPTATERQAAALRGGK